MSSAPGLVWVGPVFDPSGYADEGRGMLCALERSGVPVALRPVQRVSRGFREGLPDSERALLDRQIARPLPGQSILVQHHTAEGFQVPPHAPYLVGRTMFETHLIPPAWVSRCNAMDELWIPSQFNIDTFRKAGVRVPMHLVPGGIDTNAYRPDVERMAIPGLRGTIFLSVFEWRRGKGWDVLLRSWAEAFSPGDDVTLVLRTYPIGNADGRDNATVINECIDRFLAEECGGRTRRDVAPIVVLGEKVPAARMAGLYAMAHAYVAPTRGEGWGRPFMEASACGVPVIATRWSAHQEFLNDTNAYLIDIDGLTPADSSDVPNYEGQLWAEPNTAHLRSLLQRVHRDRGEARTIGARARADMVRDWPWSRAASAIAARVRAIGQHRVFAGAGRAAASFRPRVVADAPLFVESNWHDGTESLLAAMADEADLSLHVRNRTRRPTRPSWGLPTSGLRVSPGAPSTTPTGQDVLLSWLDQSDAMAPPTPSHGKWIIHTGNAVADRVPGQLVRRLRDQADEVWVPDESSFDACIRAGVDGDRLWRVPSPRVTDRCTPDGPRTPLGEQAATVFITMMTTARQVGPIERLLRAWDRAFDRDDDVLLVLMLPPATDRDTASARDQLMAGIVSGRLRPRGRFRIDTASRNRDDLPCMLRAADVYVDPVGGPDSPILWQVAQACGRPIVAAHTASSEAHIGHDGGWLVPARVDRPGEMAPDRLSDALHAACVRTERERRSEAAVARAERSPASADVAAEAVRRVRALHDRSARRIVSGVDAIDAHAMPGARPVVVLVHADWHDGSCSGIVRSYAESFGADDPVTLAVCLDPAQGLTLAEAQGRIAEAVAAAGVDPSNVPDLLLIPDAIDDRVRASLVCRSDVVVALDDGPLAALARANAVPVIETLTPATWRGRLDALLAPVLAA